MESTSTTSQSKSQPSTQTEPTPPHRLQIPSKKLLINDFHHQLVKQFHSNELNPKLIKSISIQGNSYSKQFCAEFSQFIKQFNNIEDLNINDIFVSRNKEQIPTSIESISVSLKSLNLLRLDISNNAVNPYGAKALLKYLEGASSLQVLLIYNCGLGPLGVAEIAQGLKGTPKLKTLSIGRNRMENQGIIALAASIEYVPELQDLFVYQNTLKDQGLTPLLIQLRKNCKNLRSLDLCDSFLRGKSTYEMGLLLQQNTNIKNINISDCLNEDECGTIIEALQRSSNRGFEKMGLNYIELSNNLALRLLAVAKEMKLIKLELTGNELSKKVIKEFTQYYKDTNILSKFQDDQEDYNRVFEEIKL